MNARSLPLTTATLADISLLECEIPTISAATAASQLLAALQLDTEERVQRVDDQHVHHVQAQTLVAQADPIDVVAVAADEVHARRAALHAAISRWAQIDVCRTVKLESASVATYIRRPDAIQAFPDILPTLAEQPSCFLGTVQFQRIGHTDTLCVPLALVNADYRHNRLQRQVMPGVRDDFDYTAIAQTAGCIGSFAGASRDEALVLGLLAAQERLCASEWAAAGIAIAKEGNEGIGRVLDSDIPESLEALMQTASAQCGARVHLLRIISREQTPTLVAYADHADPGKRALAFGAGFTCTHAASRALRNLLQLQMGTQDPRGQVSPTWPAAQAALIGRELCKRLHVMLDYGQCPSTTLDGEEMPMPTQLSERLQMLCDRFDRNGMVPWFMEYDLCGQDHAVHCVQVMLTPFDAYPLVLHGMPGVAAGMDAGHAANEGGLPDKRG